MRTVVVPADSRATTTTDWLVSRHSFSFGDNYEPDNTHHGVLMIFNEDTLAPHTGYLLHRHRATEILTWVLSGTLSHADSRGNSGRIRPGLIQRMSAGTGVEHSERNETDEPVRFLQMTLVTDRPTAEPSYAQADVSASLNSGTLLTLASGIPGTPGAVDLGNRDAALHVVRPRPGNPARIPAAPFVHIFVSRGSISLVDAGELFAGDAVRLWDTEALSVAGGADSEVLIWQMTRGLTD